MCCLILNKISFLLFCTINCSLCTTLDEITPVLKYLHCLKINDRIAYTIWMLTYKSYYNIIYHRFIIRFPIGLDFHFITYWSRDFTTGCPFWRQPHTWDAIPNNYSVWNSTNIVLYMCVHNSYKQQQHSFTFQTAL